jgi:biopolymer transport protein ExbD
MKSRGLRNIVIELTSLLDVVMILIFAVMINYSNVTAQTEEDYKQASEELEALSEDYDIALRELELARAELADGDIETLLANVSAANSRQEAYEYLDEMIVIINVKLENYDDNKYRILSYGVGSELGTASDPIAREDSTAFDRQLNRLEDYLYTEVNNAAPDAPVFIVFSYDPDNVYYDDCNRLITLLRDKKSLRDLVFFCENALKEAN